MVKETTCLRGPPQFISAADQLSFCLFSALSKAESYAVLLLIYISWDVGEHWIAAEDGIYIWEICGEDSNHLLAHSVWS